MDAKVHAFANGALPPSPFDNEVRPAEFGSGWAPNGSNPSAHDGVAFSQMEKDHSKEDIAARGMDKYVYGFSSGATYKYENEERPPMAPAPNGSDPSSHAQMEHNSKGDINPRGMDAKVHGFANGALPPSPFDNEVRPDTGFVPNGSDPSSHAQIEHQSKGDINPRGMDAKVHAFANGALPPSPFDNEIRPAEFGSGWAPNGSNPSAHDGVAFSQMEKDHSKEDIAARGMDKYVYGFSSGATYKYENEERPPMAPAPNGSDPSSHAQMEQKSKGDIN